MGDEASKKECKLYLLLKDYPTFNLEKAVCNHGFFMMAPNVWDPCTKSLTRPLRLSNSTNSVNVTISKPPQYQFLLIQVHHVDQLSHPDKDAILGQVSRMMRLSGKDESDVQQFHKIHPEAKDAGFGRIFRAPTLFEDAVKSILLCFCKWEISLRMAKDLCDFQLELSNGLHKPEPAGKVGSKRKRDVAAVSTQKMMSVGNFPTAQELASVELEVLEYHCKMGYRAFQVQKFAKDVHSGKCKLSKFETYESQKELHRQLMKIKGFGPFVSATVSICLGFYENVPIDTETIRHFKEVHRRRDCSKRKSKAISKSIFQKYAPFECLAFWFELTRYYESNVGKLSELSSSSYGLVTGTQCGTKTSE